MAELGAYQEAVNLFKDFRSDAFFSDAVYPLQWVYEKSVGNVFDPEGSAIYEFVYSLQVFELGGSSKVKKVSTVNGLFSTDRYVKGLVSEIATGDIIIPIDASTVSITSDTIDYTTDISGSSITVSLPEFDLKNFDKVVFAGETYTVVHSEVDPVKATFELFLRA